MWWSAAEVGAGRGTKQLNKWRKIKKEKKRKQKKRGNKSKE